MKTFKRIVLMAFVALSIMACNKDDDGDNNGENNGGAEHFTAKIDGTTFTASTDPASLIGGTKSTSSGMTILAAQGSTNNGNVINFSITNYTGTGTYTTGDGPTNTNLIMYFNLNSQQGWASNLATSQAGIDPGEIKVTSESGGVVEGTFRFKGYNANDQTTKNITEGKFKVVLDN